MISWSIRPDDSSAGRLGRLANGAMAALVLTLLAALVARWFFSVRYSLVAICIDVLLLMPLSLAVALAARRRWQPWFAVLVPVLLLVLGQAIKIAMMGAPIYAADISNVVELLRVLSGPRLFLASVGIILLTALLLVSLWADRKRLGWLSLVVAWPMALLILAPRIVSFNDADATPQVDRVVAHGSLSYLLYSFALHQHDQQTIPDRAAVADALRLLSITAETASKSSNAGFRHRAIHVVLLESIWDVTQLAAFRFSEDPFDSRFRAAWEQSGRSAILSPAFGGATANAEFEFLCGLPAVRHEVTFAAALQKSLPCLPRVLRDAGYVVTASHPYRADFWSRNQAYPLLGFERFRPIDAFELDDLDGVFLSDQSTYRQVLDWAGMATDPRPKFNYVVSLSSHYAYDRNRTKRPDIVRVTPDAALLQAYANAARYSTAAFMDYAGKILIDDPDAIILAFGDHAPVLGTNPDPYRLSGLGLGSTEDSAGHAYPIVASTPLLVFDGRKGAISMGQLPLYRLAPKLLALLGAGHPLLPHASLSLSEDDIRMRARLFFGRMLVRDGNGQWRGCQDESGDCAAAVANRAAMVVVRDDLIRGHQHTLSLLKSRQYAKPVRMSVDSGYGKCGFDVADWGPRKIKSGSRFNAQADGGNAFWFSLRNVRGDPSVRVAGIHAKTIVNNNTASVNIGSPVLLRTPGTYPVVWNCPDGSQGMVGDFVVEAPDVPSP